MHRSNISYLAIFLPLLPAALASTCYFPNGNTAGQYFACSTGSSSASVCCGPGYACLSNGLCEQTTFAFQQPGSPNYLRGACTDPEWKDPACPSFCVNTANGDTLSDMVGVQKCSATSDDIYTCMDSASSDCDKKVNVLSFTGSPSALTTIGVAAAASKPSSSPNSKQSPAHHTPNLGLIIGASVGGAVFLLLLLTGALFWIFRRRSVKSAASTYYMQQERKRGMGEDVTVLITPPAGEVEDPANRGIPGDEEDGRADDEEHERFLDQPLGGGAHSTTAR